jgi:hypothetical protein
VGAHLLSATSGQGQQGIRSFSNGVWIEASVEFDSLAEIKTAGSESFRLSPQQCLMHSSEAEESANSANATTSAKIFDCMVLNE